MEPNGAGNVAAFVYYEGAGRIAKGTEMNLLQIHEPGETPLPHENAAAIGIDLGTTYSVVAVASDGQAEVLHNIHGHALVPSAVYYREDGAVEVGYPARARWERGESGVIVSVK